MTGAGPGYETLRAGQALETLSPDSGSIPTRPWSDAMTNVSAFKPLVLAGAVALAAAVPAALAGPMVGVPAGSGPGMAMMDMLDDAGVSDAQRQQIRLILRAAREDWKQQQEKQQALRQQQTRLWGAPTLDAQALEGVRRQQSVLREEASVRMHRAMLEVAKVLTPDQRAKMAERAAKRAQRLQEHRRERWQQGAPEVMRERRGQP